MARRFLTNGTVKIVEIARILGLTRRPRVEKPFQIRGLTVPSLPNAPLLTCGYSIVRQRRSTQPTSTRYMPRHNPGLLPTTTQILSRPARHPSQMASFLTRASTCRNGPPTGGRLLRVSSQLLAAVVWRTTRGTSQVVSLIGSLPPISASTVVAAAATESDHLVEAQKDRRRQAGPRPPVSGV